MEPPTTPHITRHGTKARSTGTITTNAAANNYNGIDNYMTCLKKTRLTVSVVRIRDVICK